MNAIVAARTNWWTDISAFDLASIQTSKNETSVTTCHRVDLPSMAFLIKVAVWLPGILVADEDRFENPPTSES